MEKLRRAIKEQGCGIGCDIVKVDMFLNHRIDTALLFEMGQELARRFVPVQPQAVLTVEASGIALAVSTAHHLGNIPVVFAKKTAAGNLGSDMAQAKVTSFTRGTEHIIRVDRAYLPQGMRVLIVDDFLAQGEAVRGMMRLIEDCGAILCGVGIGIEKAFQPGGKQLRQAGIQVESLAIVCQIEDGHILLADD